MAALGLAVAGCGGSSYGGGKSSSSSAKSSGGAYGSSSAGAKSSAAGGGNEVDTYDNYFKPKTLSGKAGSTVKVDLKNEGKAEHTFTLDSQKIDQDLPPGKSATVSVKVPASGSVQFYCRYHKSLGMVGTLEAS